MDAVASPPKPDTGLHSAASMPDQVSADMSTLIPANIENVEQELQLQQQAEQSTQQRNPSLPVDQEMSQMEVDQDSFALREDITSLAPLTTFGATLETLPSNLDESRGVPSFATETVTAETPNPDTSRPVEMAGPSDTASKPTSNEPSMDAVIYDVPEPTTTVTMPNNLTDEQTSPLHRMAEIALATSPIMSNGTINRGNDYRPDGTMVLPSQQYYQSGSSLFAPPTLSARERYEIDASRTLGKSESTPLYPSSYPPSSSHSDPHPFGYRQASPLHPGMNGKRRSSADDSAGHRYTHSRLQPKNKSPPSFRVVQLRGGVDGAGEGVPQQQMSVPSDSGMNGTSPSHSAAQLDHQPSAPHDAWQGNEHASHSDRQYHPHPSYTDPIPHAQIHRYQPPETYSTATSPIMNEQSNLPPVQTQNKLSLFDLVLAAEAAEEQEKGAAMEMQTSPTGDDHAEVGPSGGAEKRSKQRKPSKKKSASDKLSANTGTADSPSVPPKSHKKKEKDPSSGNVKVEEGIVGHIPLRENSRSISKLLWAEPGQRKTSRRVDLPVDHVDPDEDEDIMPEEEPAPVTYIDADEQEDVVPKGKKRQSNGAVKTSNGTANGKSGSASKAKGKKKVEEVMPMEGVEEEIDSQPKKKGKKNVSSSRAFVEFPLTLDIRNQRASQNQRRLVVKRKAAQDPSIQALQPKRSLAKAASKSRSRLTRSPSSSSP